MALVRIGWLHRSLHGTAQSRVLNNSSVCDDPWLRDSRGVSSWVQMCTPWAAVVQQSLHFVLVG